MEHEKAQAIDKQEALRRTGRMPYQGSTQPEQLEKYAALIMTPIVIKGVHYLPHKPKE